LNVKTNLGLTCAITWPQPATKNHAVTLSLLPPPPLQWDGEENWKAEAKLVGWDKNSLTEQQREKKIITIILIKRI